MERKMKQPSRSSDSRHDAIDQRLTHQRRRDTRQQRLRAEANFLRSLREIP